jgi:hypothetical protein
MFKNILWLGGWASNIKCWEKEIERLYPEQKHTFLDTHLLLPTPDLLQNTLQNLPTDTAIAAWSLGSLWVHQQLSLGILKSSHSILSICPIFDFCNPQGHWKSKVLRRMQQKLALDKTQVLKDFWKQFQAPDPFEKTWLEQAEHYSEESLKQGLDYLMNTQVNLNYLKPYASQIFFVNPQNDLLSPSLLALNQNPFRSISINGGHLPFLENAQTFNSLFAKMQFA